eukprot:CAMPEP_0174256512 /NCGR_PEP_ID=MMETSP0439-20130205/5731_1 /TAXON_ID=0 /ORGANISM="Stereomyxa ramosa, Strain Chinc5" /LENGTH=449 /DNA_ID=CAMNT_0015339147 /DNA_START=236 /DNA_END=1583 /DNA_ORIENTATION=-
MKTRPIRSRLGDYRIIAQVGEGTYGRVYKAQHTKTSKVYALKVFFNIEEEDGLSFTAIREIKYLQQLKGKQNIISLQGTFFSEENELVLVSEYMDHDLSGVLTLQDDVNHYNSSQIKCLMKQILTGLHECHASGIMHRDIKAANLLLNKGILKLADFGLATTFVFRPIFSTNVVTLWYRAPELLLGENKYGPKVDMWSAGCIFIELLTRQSPFPGKTEKQQMELIFKTCGTPTEKNWEGVANLEGYKKFVKGKMIVYTNRLREVFSGKVEPLALDLICKLLALDPAKRITASDALDHDYFWKDCPPCQPAELPIYRSMHEFEAKKKRIERQAKRQKVNGYEIPDMYSRGPMSHQPPYPPRTTLINSLDLIMVLETLDTPLAPLYLGNIPSETSTETVVVLIIHPGGWITLDQVGDLMAMVIQSIQDPTKNLADLLNPEPFLVSPLLIFW